MSHDHDSHDDQPDDALDDTVDEAMDEAMDALNAARERLASEPVEIVILNHVMGLYELAAIHLSASPANLPESALAIDAVACLVEGLGERLGPEIDTMRSALSNIQMAFVQIKQTVADEA